MNEHQELRDAVDGWAARINAAWQATVSNIVETGQALIDAKADLPHGTFTAMVEDDLAFGPRAAERLMAIASHPALSNPTHASHLPVSWTTLAELARLDASTVEKLIKEERINPGLERKDVALLLPPPKTKKTAPKRAPPAAKPRHPDPPPEVVEPAPVAIVEPARPVVKDEPEIDTTEYMLVEPDDVPPVVHVDPAPVDSPMIEHLRSELAAVQEENEQLKSTISDLKAKAVEREEEITLLMALRARLEDRARKRDEEFAAFLFDHIVSDDVGILELLNKAHLSEVVEAFQRVQAARQQVAEPEEPAPPTQPVETGAQTWDDFLEAYFMADDCPVSPNDHPKINGGFVRWADDHGIDIEGYPDAPSEVKHLWLLAAKNCRVKSVARNSYQDARDAILKRYGSGKRHVSIPMMAAELEWRRQDIAEAMDVMTKFDFDGSLIASSKKVGKDTLYTIRRPAKVSAK